MFYLNLVNYNFIYAVEEDNLLWKSFESVITSVCGSVSKIMVKEFLMEFIKNKLILWKLSHSSPINLKDKRNSVIGDLQFDNHQAEQIAFLVYLIKNLKYAKNLKESITVLLAGPPGTGKSRISSFLASIAIRFNKKTEAFFINGSDFKTEKNTVKIVRIFFDNMIKKVKNGYTVILAIDEVDTLLTQDSAKATNRSEITSLFLTIMSEMDTYLQNNKSSGNFILIINTNFADTIDSALIRRFKHFVELNIPTNITRLKILEKYLYKKNKIFVHPFTFTIDSSNIQTEVCSIIIDVCVNLSPGELQNAVTKAKNLIIYNYMTKNMYRKEVLNFIKEEDLQIVLKTIAKDDIINNLIIHNIHKSLFNLDFPWDPVQIKSTINQVLSEFNLEQQEKIANDLTDNLLFFLKKLSNNKNIVLSMDVNVLIEAFQEEVEKRIKIIGGDEDVSILENLQNLRRTSKEKSRVDEYKLLKAELKDINKQEKLLKQTLKDMIIKKKGIKKNIEKIQTNSEQKN